MDMKVGAEEMKLDCVAGLAKKKNLDVAAMETAKEQDKEAGRNLAHQFVAQQQRAKTEFEIDVKKVESENAALDQDRKRVDIERQTANRAMEEQKEKETKEDEAVGETAKKSAEDLRVNDAAVAKAKDDASKADEAKLDKLKDEEAKKVRAGIEAKNAQDLDLVSKVAADKANILAPP